MQKLNSWVVQHAAKVVLLALLLVPAGVALLSAEAMSTEQRKLSAPPGLPHALSDTLKYPAQLDAWANDNFGLRTTLVTLNNRLLGISDQREHPFRFVVNTHFGSS